MAQQYFKTIYIDDFIKNVNFTLDEPISAKILGYSSTICVKKADNELEILEPIGEAQAFLKGFDVQIINKLEEDTKFICDFSWGVAQDLYKYRLYKNDDVIYEDFNNYYKYDFSNEEDGEYIFKIECLYNNNFVEETEQSENMYTYPFLDIPIDYNYKYFFYYYIENCDEDVFGSILTPIAVDDYGVSLIRDNITEWVDTSQHCEKVPALVPIDEKGCYVSVNDPIYFSEKNKSYAGFPYTYFVLELNKKKGQRDIEPVVDKIDIFIEKIDEEEGE